MSLLCRHSGLDPVPKVSGANPPRSAIKAGLVSYYGMSIIRHPRAEQVDVRDLRLGVVGSYVSRVVVVLILIVRENRASEDLLK
jgi:hypothetical protein